MRGETESLKRGKDKDETEDKVRRTSFVSYKTSCRAHENEIAITKVLGLLYNFFLFF